MAHGTLLEYQACLKADLTNRISASPTSLFRLERVRMPGIMIRIRAQTSAIADREEWN